MGVEMEVAQPTPQERLQERLNDPRTVASLNHLLDRLDVIAFSFDALEGFLARAEVVAESVSSGLAEIRPVIEESGGRELIEQMPKLARAGSHLGEIADRVDWQRVADSGLVEKLSAPQTLDAASRLVDRIELVAFMVDALDGFLKRSDEIAETVSEGAADLKRAMPEIDPDKVRALSDRLPELVDAGEVLAEAGLFDRSTVEVLGRLGRTIAESHTRAEAPRQAIGIFGLIKALREPQVQRTLQLALDIARRYGDELERRES